MSVSPELDAIAKLIGYVCMVFFCTIVFAGLWFSAMHVIRDSFRRRGGVVEDKTGHPRPELRAVGGGVPRRVPPHSSHPSLGRTGSSRAANESLRASVKGPHGYMQHPTTPRLSVRPFDLDGA